MAILFVFVINLISPLRITARVSHFSSRGSCAVQNKIGITIRAIFLSSITHLPRTANGTEYRETNGSVRRLLPDRMGKQIIVHLHLR